MNLNGILDLLCDRYILSVFSWNQDIALKMSVFISFQSLMALIEIASC